MRKILLLLSYVSISVLGFSQHVHCGTDEFVKEQISKGVEQPTLVYSVPEEVLNFSDLSHGKKAVVTIPIVFHVIHEYGAENISNAQILDQMRIINEDFRRQNADTALTRGIFKSIATDCEIEFKLATKDPSGNCTDGITRTVSALTNGGDEAAKQLIVWDQKRYLNVWVVKSIGRAANILGYAVLPTSNDKSGDGVILLASYVGSIGTADENYMGRTLTHEIGHWLGLWHPFQNAQYDNDGVPIPDCGTSNCQRSGDWICDTPPVFEASFGCNTSKNSCTNDAPDLLDQIENFMDYADGRCANMFTRDQRTRMLGYLGNTSTNGRGSHISTSTATSTGINISNPCAAKADFHIVDRQVVLCEGKSIQFEDLSWNGIVVDRVWTFEGGSPSSSTFANPTVKYNTGGKYKVTLKVTNAQGTSEVTKTEFIEVQDAVAELASPFLETFESPFSEFTWEKETIGNYGWKRVNNVGYNVGYASVCAIDDKTASGLKFSLTSSNFDLSLHKDLDPILSFRTAYSMRASGSAGERVVIYGSEDCGETWRVLKSLIGITTLSSTNQFIPDWAPTSNSDWKLQVISLKQYGFENSTNLLIRFEVTSNSGNTIYIDDINVDRNVLSTGQNKLNSISFNLLPNPSAGNFEVRLNAVYETINIEVTDILGQKLQTLKIAQQADGRVEQEIFIHQAGIYFIRVYGLTLDYTKRIIISE
ncbi:MAG: PKD repeat protein [Bacteroidia bacterium]|jgi:PKD repeat protein